MSSELTDDCECFDMPVPCSQCGKIIELNDSNFWTPACDCSRFSSCSHGLCDDCNDEWTEVADAVEAAACCEQKPLFIALKAEYYDKYERREKDTEYRAYGKRWNESTCEIGRKAILSKGYGKQARMSGIVMSAKVVPPTPDFLKIYGPDKKCFAIRFCKLKRESSGERIG